MALTSAQEILVYRYLGTTPMWRGVCPRVRNAINALNAFGSATLEAEVVGLLDKLQALDVQLAAAGERLRFQRVEDVVFAGNAELANLRSTGRMWVGQLGALLGCEAVRDVFSSATPQGGQMKHG